MTIYSLPVTFFVAIQLYFSAMTLLYCKRFLLFIFLILCSYLAFRIVDSAPLMWDDYHFHYTLQYDGQGGYKFSSEKWHNFNDFLYSFIHHRENQNARLANHIFLIIAYLGGMDFCSILNTICLISMWLVLTRYSFNRITIGSLSISFLLAILLLAVPDRIFLWRDGCVNYVYGALLLLLLIQQLKMAETTKSRTVLICLFSFLCGCWHEGLSAPLAAATLGFAFIQRLKKNPFYKNYLLSGVFTIVGFLVLLSSPFFIHGRLNESSDHIGDISYWVGAAYRTIEFSFPVLISYVIATLINRKNLLNHFLFYLASANLIPTVLVFARAGAWGGGLFFFSFSVLVYLLASISRHAEKHDTLYSIPGCTATLIILISTFIFISNVRSDFEAIMAQETDSPVRRCDYFRNKEVPWVLKAPFYSMQVPVTYAGTFYGKPAFSVIFNQKVKDSSLYTAFEAYDKDQMVWLKFDDCSLIRLAQNYAPHFKHSFKGKRNTADNGTERLILDSSFESDWLSSLILRCMHIPHVTEYYSYNNGFYYLVLPKEVNNMNKIETEVRNPSHQTEWIEIHPTL